MVAQASRLWDAERPPGGHRWYAFATKPSDTVAKRVAEIL